MTDALAPILRNAKGPHIVSWNGKPVKSIKRTLRDIVKRAGLEGSVNGYSFRHTMARELRKRGVPKWEVDGFMGHNQGDMSDVYAPYSPVYLSNAREAIDTFMKEIGAPLRSEPARPFLAHFSPLVDGKNR